MWVEANAQSTHCSDTQQAMGMGLSTGVCTVLLWKSHSQATPTCEGDGVGSSQQKNEGRVTQSCYAGFVVLVGLKGKILLCQGDSEAAGS